MNRNNLPKFLLVLAVVILSFIEMYPPVGRDLAVQFQNRAVVLKNRDATFTNILEKMATLQTEHPQRAFANLLEAIGTNDIARYFPPEDFENALKQENPTLGILNQLQREAAGKIKLGLDLQGGTSFLVQMDTNYLRQGTNRAPLSAGELQSALLQAVEVLRKRVDRLGVSEPVIQPEGVDSILIQLPGLSAGATDDARKTIQKAAFLEFKMVHEDSAGITQRGEPPPPGYELMKIREKGRNGVESVESFIVRKKAELTGSALSGANVGYSPLGQPDIEFSCNPEGAKQLGELTHNNLGRRMGIVLDGVLYSAPTIKSEISSRGEITGNFTDETARQLANALQNPLQAPVHILAEKKVDPTLGSATVKSGVRSAIIGTILVAGFMACYYLVAGCVADVALITNIIILLGVMCSIGTTLTLPGIAGVVLTIGMAVDANVLIFERIREESAKGKSLYGALSAGYARAFGTIFDSHVTTLISSVILIYMGTGSVKGFGVTLTIGVAASLFTALVVTRLIFDVSISRGWLKKLPMLHIIRATKLDFMKLALPAFILSWSIIVVGIGYGAYRVQKGNLFGPDFVGGDSLTLTYSREIPADQLTAAIVKDTGIREPIVQYQSDLGSSHKYLSIISPLDTGTNVLTALQKAYPDANFTSPGADHVGPTIGAEIRDAAIMASLLSLLGILIYVAMRYEFSFAVGAVLAIIHDVLMTIGCYCLTGLLGPEHTRQFNATMVAAILTIIGFSINDTIVIFDRIREDLKLGVRGSFREVINQALNQTLSRTIITSGTVFLATSSLYLFGGGAINDFAFTFLVGIITGTYSSIYIASALVLWWHKGVRPRTGSQVIMAADAATAKA